MSAYALSIDPGKNIGWALWDVSSWDDLVLPVDFGSILPRKEWEWDVQLLYSLRTFQERVIDRYGISLSDAYVEMPRLMEGAGMVAARSGALVKLVMATGGIFEALRANDTRFHEVPVSWKGQLDKDMMKVRIQRRYGDLYDPRWGNLTLDAFCIGLWAKGLFVMEGVHES
jgi:hypothetical protein